MRKKKNTPLLAAVYEAGDGIKKLRIVTFRAEPNRAETETKAALGKQNRVRELAKLFAAQTPDLAVRRKTEEAVKELDSLIPQQV